MANTTEFPLSDAQIEAFVAAVSTENNAKLLRRYLRVQEGGGATVVRIDAVRALMAWDYDQPIPPKKTR